MGVKGLMTYILKNFSSVSTRVNLTDFANASTKGFVDIVVDGNCFIYWICEQYRRHYPMDSAVDANKLFVLIDDYLRNCKHAHVYCWFVFDGITDSRKISCKCERFLEQCKGCLVVGDRRDPGQSSHNSRILPLFALDVLYCAIHQHKLPLLRAPLDGDIGIVVLARKLDAFGIMSNDTDMVVYDSGRTKLVLFSHIEFYTPGADAATVLSGEPVGDNSTMECIARVLDRDAIARSLGIGVELLPLLAGLCGMDMLQPYYQTLLHQAVMKKGKGVTAATAVSAAPQGCPLNYCMCVSSEGGDMVDLQSVTDPPHTQVQAQKQVSTAVARGYSNSRSNSNSNRSKGNRKKSRRSHSKSVEASGVQPVMASDNGGGGDDLPSSPRVCVWRREVSSLGQVSSVTNTQTQPYTSQQILMSATRWLKRVVLTVNSEERQLLLASNTSVINAGDRVLLRWCQQTCSLLFESNRLKVFPMSAPGGDNDGAIRCSQHLVACVLTEYLMTCASWYRLCQISSDWWIDQYPVLPLTPASHQWVHVREHVLGSELKLCERDGVMLLAACGYGVCDAGEWDAIQHIRGKIYRLLLGSGDGDGERTVMELSCHYGTVRCTDVYPDMWDVHTGEQSSIEPLIVDDPQQQACADGCAGVTCVAGVVSNLMQRILTPSATPSFQWADVYSSHTHTQQTRERFLLAVICVVWQSLTLQNHHTHTPPSTSTIDAKVTCFVVMMVMGKLTIPPSQLSPCSGSKVQQHLVGWWRWELCLLHVQFACQVSTYVGADAAGSCCTMPAEIGELMSRMSYSMYEVLRDNVVSVSVDDQSDNLVRGLVTVPSLGLSALDQEVVIKESVATVGLFCHLVKKMSVYK